MNVLVSMTVLFVHPAVKCYYCSLKHAYILKTATHLTGVLLALTILHGCGLMDRSSNSLTGDLNPVSETLDNVAQASAIPAISIVRGNAANPSQSVKTALNDFTEMTVGMYKDHYAILIETGTPEIPGNYSAEDEPFGDEIAMADLEEKAPEANDEPLIPESRTEPEAEGILVAEGTPEVPSAPETAPADEEFIEKGTNESQAQMGSFNINEIDQSYLLGKFNPSTHKDFTAIAREYCNRRGMYMRKDAYEAFKQMHLAAAKDGVNLKIVSATRSFSGQKKIWEDKWVGNRRVQGQDLSKAIPFGVDRAKKILEYSSMPGTSRHHWGTDIDLNALTNSYFGSGEGKKIYNWLNMNARKFGFYQPYTAKNGNRPDGYNEEKWHWSYLPVSKELTRSFEDQIDETHISGFQGAETATDIEVVKKYVMGIDPECL